jgi:dolichol-phosphate mannosyltransferase
MTMDIKTGRNEHVGRFIRFGIVGGIGVIVNMGFYTIFHNIFGIFDMIAVNIAIEISILSNFVLNERWTFGDRAVKGWKKYLKRMISFNIGNGVVTYLVQPATLFVLTRYFGMWDKLALLIGIVLAALANYSISTKLIFKR